MKRAAAMSQPRRRTATASSAAELGIPAVVGCVNATQSSRKSSGDDPAPRAIPATCTTECSNTTAQHRADSLPRSGEISMNIAIRPRIRIRGLPNKGVGSRAVHHQPHDRVPPGAARVRQAEPTQGGHFAADRDIRSGELYVDKLSEGIAQIAAAFAPEPVMCGSRISIERVRNLIGQAYEPHEENPMLGFPRSLHRQRLPVSFGLATLKRVRTNGLTNVQ